MTDWAAVAAAIQAPLEPEDWASVIEPLEKLERDFRPLEQALPPMAPLWVGLPDSE
jgi:hypothetical protein